MRNLNSWIICLATLFFNLGGFSLASPRAAQAGPSPIDSGASSYPVSFELTSNQPASWPPDPTADIAWSPAQYRNVGDIQAAFNNARIQENSQLNLSIPLISLPSQAEWNAISEAQRALWLINRERIDRSVTPLTGLEANVTAVAQSYADFLLATNQFGHAADGHDPWWRMDQNPAIQACHEFLPIGENLAARFTSASSISLALERDVYAWMYTDAGSVWGHRRAILYYPYNDDSGQPGSEGFLGIGRAKGGPYTINGTTWSYAEITVMNVFDPCSTWASSPATYSISGQVASNQGGNLSGVTITANGSASPVSTTSDLNGNYTITAMTAGTYTLTPSKSGYTFLPPNRQATVSSANVQGQDFVGTPVVLPPPGYFAYCPALQK